MFDKKEKIETETKQVLPEGEYREKESSGGKYALNAKNELVFRKTTQKRIFDHVLRVFVKQKPTTEEIPIRDMNGHKEIFDNIVVKKILRSRTEINGFEALFFLQEIVYRVRHELKYVFLQREERSRKIYLKDFDTSVCYQCPHSSNQYVIVETINTKPVDKDTVIKMYQEGKISDVYSDIIDGVYKKEVFTR